MDADSLNKNYKILIVEDEPGLNKLIQNLLNSEGYNASGIYSGADAVSWVRKNPDNLLVIDYLLSDMTAIELVDKLNAESLSFNFIVLTGFQDQKTAIELMKKGAIDYIIKDSDFIDLLIKIIQKALNEIENKNKLKEAYKKIEAQNQLLSNIISHLPNYIFWKDKNSCYQGCNEKYAKILGFNSSSEVVGKNDIELGLDKKDAAKFIKYDKEVITHGNPILGIEDAYIKNIGKKLPLLTHRAPLKDKDGNITGVIAICTDISELEEIDETIKVNEERFRELFDNMVSGVAIYSVKNGGEDFIIKDINKAIEKIEVVRRGNVLGKSVIELFPGIKEFGLFDVFKKVYKTGKPEYFPLKKYSDYRISGWRDNFVYKLSNGEIVAIYDDRTQEKQYEELLNEYKLAIESSNDLIACINKDYKFVFVNQAFLTTFNLQKENIEDKSFEFILGKDFFKNSIKKQIDLALNGEFIENEAETNKRIFKINYYPLKKEKDSNTNFDAVVAFFRDITQQKVMEQELKRFNEELENRVKERTEELVNVNNELESFAYSVSHDLRAPLRHIYGFSELLKKELGLTLSETGEKYLANIIDSSKKMSLLIDDLLSFSRMGRSNINLCKIDMNKLLSDSINFLENEVKNRDVEWVIKKLPKVTGDLSMLRQVWINFLSNALKYTRRKKKAVIEIGVLSENNDENIFYIKDNGIGFDTKYADKLFGVFQRLHADKDFEGTGIGLALVKRIINRHNGNVRAESKMGKGASFFFTLPK